MRAEKVGRDTMLARIVQMVAEAQRSRAPIQRVADRRRRLVRAAVIVIAVVAFAVWAIVGPEPRLALRARRGRVGADHRVPLCARPGDAHVDHGRHGAAALKPAS